MYQNVLNHLPYKSSFRFVDHLQRLDENGVEGTYTLREDAFFYEDHFPGHPVTPGVIVTEIMAQIGLVVLGIYLLLQQAPVAQPQEQVFPLFTSSEVEFYKVVLPGETVRVVSEKMYFRFGKLKCKVTMLDSNNNRIAKGTFSGIMRKAGDLK
ncbi:beta-hydroxyacyl-ACP dehydratase [Mucilaginibacter koreensis]